MPRKISLLHNQQDFVYQSPKSEPPDSRTKEVEASNPANCNKSKPKGRKVTLNLAFPRKTKATRHSKDREKRIKEAQREHAYPLLRTEPPFHRANGRGRCGSNRRCRTTASASPATASSIAAATHHHSCLPAAAAAFSRILRSGSSWICFCPTYRSREADSVSLMEEKEQEKRSGEGRFALLCLCSA